MTRTPLQVVVDALELHGRRVKRNGDQVDAQCPAHDDHAPSLSVRYDRGAGKVLINCHVGCSPDDVIGALGLAWTDLFDPKAEDGKVRTLRPEIVATYDYTDEQGNLLFQKVRYLPRAFKVRHPAGRGGWEWNIGRDTRRVLYRLPELRTAIAASRPVLVVEGEKDADRVVADLGMAATCNYDGAGGKWHPGYTETLRGARVLVVADNDDPGFAHARAAAAALDGVAAQVRIFRPAIDHPKADISDHLDAGLGIDDLVPMAWPPPRSTERGSGVTEVRPEGDAASLLDGLRSGTWLDAQVFPALGFVVPEIIPEGTTVLAGPPKVGKSWTVLGIALAAGCGGVALGCLAVGPPRPVLYMALEDGHRRLQARCRSLLGADAPIPASLDVIIDVGPGLHLATVAEWLIRNGHRSPLVIVDTLARVMPSTQSGESAYQRDYRVLANWQALVGAYPGAALLIVHHTRKLASEDYVDSVSGTLGITGAADTTLVLSRGRGEHAGVLRVTGRDIVEAEYAIDKADDGTWTLTGGSLVAARKAATTDRATVDLGDRSADIVRLVTESGVRGIAPKAVSDKLGIKANDAAQYLRRLAKAGRITKSGRGVYCAATSDDDSVDDPAMP